MREFKDKTGQTWQIDLPVGTVTRVKTASEKAFDLFDPTPLADPLSTDEGRFWELLWYLVEPQAKERSISAEQFGQLMASDSLHDARRLFFEEWLDFFRRLHRPDKAAVVEKVSQYLAKGMELTVAKLKSQEMTEIDKLVEERMATSLNESFGKLRASLASTPAASLGDKSTE